MSNRELSQIQFSNTVIQFYDVQVSPNFPLLDLEVDSYPNFPFSFANVHSYSQCRLLKLRCLNVGKKVEFVYMIGVQCHKNLDRWPYLPWPFITPEVSPGDPTHSTWVSVRRHLRCCPESSSLMSSLAVKDVPKVAVGEGGLGFPAGCPANLHQRNHQLKRHGPVSEPGLQHHGL